MRRSNSDFRSSYYSTKIFQLLIKSSRWKCKVQKYFIIFCCYLSQYFPFSPFLYFLTPQAKTSSFFSWVSTVLSPPVLWTFIAKRLTTFFLLRFNQVFRKEFLSNLGSRGHISFATECDLHSSKYAENSLY
jgi:hypothetical protein